MHGTSVASAAVGAVCGLAKEANVIALKIWDKPNLARSAHVYDAFEWIVNEIPKTGRPSIVNMSVSFGPDAVLDRQIRAAIKAGIHFVGAAGNTHQDAGLRFPGGSECSYLERVNFQGLTLH